MKFSTYRMLLALAFLLSCGGCFLGFWGKNEGKLGEHATAEPATMDLARLEAGDKLDNYHIVLGPHYACYYSTVYSYYKKKRSTDQAGPSTRLSYSLYPIVSADHPKAKALAELLQKLAGDQQIPDEFPEIDNFAVLVKTERFHTMGDIPDGLRREESVRGLVINEIRHLDADETNLIRQSFPKADLKKVWILEEGRAPSSATTSTLALFAGIALGLFGVAAGIVFTVWFLIALASGKS